MTQFQRDNFARVLRIWQYLWDTYRTNGHVSRDISDSIGILQDALSDIRLGGN